MEEDIISLSRLISSPAIRSYQLDNQKSISVYVIGANSISELIQIVSPLCEGGRNVTFWGSGFHDIQLDDLGKNGNSNNNGSPITTATTTSSSSPTPPPIITTTTTANTNGNTTHTNNNNNKSLLHPTRLLPGQWDIVTYTFRALETLSESDLRLEIFHSLELVHSQNGIVVMCLPSEVIRSVATIRSKVFPHAPSSSDVRGSINAEICAKSIENVGITQYEGTITIPSKFNIGPFLRGERLGIEQVSEWLRVPLDMVKRAGSSEFNAIKKFCERDGETILQNRTLFVYFGCPGFERDSRAQPSFESWWPNEGIFKNYGLDLWSTERATLPAANAPPVVNVAPPLTQRETNDLIESLASTTDRLELPRAIPLTALFDVLVDVWDSLDDAT
jgi:hypothetical protein